MQVMQVKLFSTAKITITKTAKPTQYTRFNDGSGYTNYEPIPAENRIEKFLGEFSASEGNDFITVHGKKDIQVSKETLTAEGSITDFRIVIM